MNFSNIFSRSVACLLIVLTLFLTEQKIFHFNKVQRINYLFHGLCLLWYTYKVIAIPMVIEDCYMLSSKDFIVFCLICRSVMHFEFSFVKGVWRLCPNPFFGAGAYPVVPAPFFEMSVFAPLHWVCSFVKNPLTLVVEVCFWLVYSVPMIYLPVLSLILHYLDNCSFITGFEVG